MFEHPDEGGSRYLSSVGTSVHKRVWHLITTSRYIHSWCISVALRTTYELSNQPRAADLSLRSHDVIGAMQWL